jgi:hypothetical protein
MQIPAGGQSSRFLKACGSLFTVVGDAWHKVTTRPPEPTQPMRQRRRSGYRANRLPTPLWAPVLAPIALELSCVLERVSRDHAGVANLRVVEQVISRPGGSFDQVPDAVLRQALAELRWIASRSRPLPAMARLLDQMQRQALEREIQSYSRALQALQKTQPTESGAAPRPAGRR